MTEPTNARGRYRFQGGQPLDPHADGHPEMAADQTGAPVASGTPSSPQELIAMQEHKPERPEKPERQQSAKLKQVLDLIDALETTAADDEQIALTMVRRLESFHDEVVDDLKGGDSAKHSQIVSWAIDADRLYRSRMLLESVDLE